MQITDQPAKLPIPFANSAGAGYVRTISETSLIGVTDGAASLPDGFPPLTFQPIASGGKAVDGRDMNGILKELSAWTRWACAGGMTFYDSAFSTKIGGYPKYAQLASVTTPGLVFVSKIDNNIADPDLESDEANWARSTSAMALNGQAASYYTDIPARLGFTPLNAAAYTAADVLAKLLTVDGAGSLLDADTLDGLHAAAFLLASTYTASDVFSKVLSLDGAGSLLDADTLDGLHAASFLRMISSNLAETGHIEFGGLILNWGVGTQTSFESVQTVTFDKPFSSQVFFVNGFYKAVDNINNDGRVDWISNTLTAATLRAQFTGTVSGTITPYYLAFGV